MSTGQAEEAWLGLLFGVGSIIFMPLFYGLFGFIRTLLMAWLYNVVASRVGGLELDLE